MHHLTEIQGQKLPSSEDMTDFIALWDRGDLPKLNNVDYTNAATVKVLQLSQSRNVLKELHMTADQGQNSIRPEFSARRPQA
jgi:hypothetical protein